MNNAEDIVEGVMNKLIETRKEEEELLNAFDKVEFYACDVLAESFEEFKELQKFKDRLHEGLSALGIEIK